MRGRKGHTSGTERTSARGIGRIVRSKAFIISASILVVLVGLHFALAPTVKYFVNRQLNAIPGYRGHVDDVGIKLWKGAYTIKGVRLEKATGKVPVPFFSADKAELAVQWSALFHGSVVGEIFIDSPKLNFVEGKSKSDSQTGVDESWQDRVKKLMPLRINRFEIDNGEVHYRSFTSTPRIDVFMHDIAVVATNLTNSDKISDTLMATVDASAKVLGDGTAKLHLDLDPFAKDPTFKLDAQMTNVDMTKINDFLLAFAKFDVAKGHFSMYTQVNASHGAFKGYVKPLFEHVEVLGDKDKKKDPAHVAWEAIVGAVKGVLNNKQKDRIATVAPFSGTFKNPTTGIWETIGGLLRNAFVRAIRPGFLEGEPANSGVQAGGGK